MGEDNPSHLRSLYQQQASLFLHSISTCFQSYTPEKRNNHETICSNYKDSSEKTPSEITSQPTPPTSPSTTTTPPSSSSLSTTILPQNILANTAKSLIVRSMYNNTKEEFQSQFLDHKKQTQIPKTPQKKDSYSQNNNKFSHLQKEEPVNDMGLSLLASIEQNQQDIWESINVLKDAASTTTSEIDNHNGIQTSIINIADCIMNHQKQQQCDEKSNTIASIHSFPSHHYTFYCVNCGTPLFPIGGIAFDRILSDEEKTSSSKPPKLGSSTTKQDEHNAMSIQVPRISNKLSTTIQKNSKVSSTPYNNKHGRGPSRRTLRRRASRYTARQYRFQQEMKQTTNQHYNSNSYNDDKKKKLNTVIEQEAMKRYSTHHRIGDGLVKHFLTTRCGSCGHVQVVKGLKRKRNDALDGQNVPSTSLFTPVKKKYTPNTKQQQSRKKLNRGDEACSGVTKLTSQANESKSEGNNIIADLDFLPLESASSDDTLKTPSKHSTTKSVGSIPVGGTTMVSHLSSKKKKKKKRPKSGGLNDFLSSLND